MREYRSESIRNVAVVGHGASGKTSLVDALAFVSGSSKRHGSIKDGTTLTDTSPEEIERKYSISLGCAFAEWKDAKVNLLDTPGFLDFQGDAIAGLTAADGALAVVAGLQDFREHLGGALHITLLKGIGQPFEVTDMRLDLVAQARHGGGHVDDGLGRPTGLAGERSDDVENANGGRPGRSRAAYCPHDRGGATRQNRCSNGWENLPKSRAQACHEIAA